MKRTRAFLILVLSIMLVFSGCSNKQDQTIQTDTALDNSEEVSRLDSPNSEKGIDLYNATDFSEGKSLVLYQFSTNSFLSVGVLDSSGQIITIDDICVCTEDMSSDEENDEVALSAPKSWTTFSSGFAYLNYTDRVSDVEDVFSRFAIISSDGDLCFLSPLDADYEILCGGDGLFLVVQRTKSTINMNSEERFGILNYKGEWVCSLADRSNYFSDNILLNSVEALYCGDHVFAFTLDTSDAITDYGVWLDLFDSDSNKYVEYSNVKMLSAFYKDKAVAIQTKVPTGYRDGEGTSILVLRRNDLSLTPVLTGIASNGYSTTRVSFVEPLISEGLISDVRFGDVVGHSNCFYDLDGNKTIDLSEYSPFFIDHEGMSRFHDNIAVVYLMKNDHYITSINTEGDFLYDPIKIVEYKVGRFNNMDYIPVKIPRNTNGLSVEQNAFINRKTGEILEVDFEVLNTSSGSTGYWSENYCRVENFFIDIYGNTLSTYLK